MALWTSQVQVSLASNQPVVQISRWSIATMIAPFSLYIISHPVRYKEHEDGFLRLQLIRYESVELTEQLMRERQNRQGEEDEDSAQTEEQEEGAASSELPVELRGVFLEEQRTESLIVGAEEGAQEEGMLYVLTGGLSQAGEDTVMLQLQDSAQ